jgi:hypothetical protein
LETSKLEELEKYLSKELHGDPLPEPVIVLPKPAIELVRAGVWVSMGRNGKASGIEFVFKANEAVADLTVYFTIEGKGPQLRPTANIPNPIPAGGQIVFSQNGAQILPPMRRAFYLNNGVVNTSKVVLLAFTYRGTQKFEFGWDSIGNAVNEVCQNEGYNFKWQS